VLLPYKPLKRGKKEWDTQFGNDYWDYLGDIRQLGRYSIIDGYFEFFYYGKGSILDLGCGQGVLLERLNHTNFSMLALIYLK